MVIHVSGIPQIVPEVEQEVGRPPVELVEEGAEAEEQQSGHAEAVVAEGEEGQGQQCEGPPPPPARSLLPGPPDGRRGHMRPALGLRLQ